MSNKGQNQRNRKSVYPYLSIDQFTKESACPQHKCYEGSGYLNVRLDLNKTPKDSFVRLFREKRSFSQHQTCETLKPRLGNSFQRQLKKVPDKRKKTAGFNPKKVGIIIDKIMTKDTKIVSEEKLSESKKEITSNKSKQHKNVLKSTTKQSSLNQFSKSKGVRLQRTKLFEQMLKRTQKLKEIYRYESEQLNIKQFNANANIRFYTEPLKMEVVERDGVEPQINGRNGIQFNRKAYLEINKYKFFAQKPPLQNNLIAIEDQKIAAIGQKSILKQQWMKTMHKYRCRRQPRQLTATHDKFVEKDLVGPWDSMEIQTQLK